jgi:hypothetical protein
MVIKINKMFRKTRKNQSLIIVVLLTTSLLVLSCAKSEGEGGLATIRGRVLVKEYNGTFTILKDTYYAQDEDVFIIYGDAKMVSDRARTTYDGWFEFRNLRPGSYQVYCYSNDSTLQTLAKIPVISHVLITGKKELIMLDEMVIFK